VMGFAWFSYLWCYQDWRDSLISLPDGRTLTAAAVSAEVGRCLNWLWGKLKILLT